MEINSNLSDWNWKPVDGFTFKSCISVWRGNVRIELESCKLLMRISGIEQRKTKPSVIFLTVRLNEIVNQQKIWTAFKSTALPNKSSNRALSIPFETNMK